MTSTLPLAASTVVSNSYIRVWFLALCTPHKVLCTQEVANDIAGICHVIWLASN